MSAAQQIGWERVGITPELRRLAVTIARAYLRKLPPNVLRCDLEQAALYGLWDGLQKQVGRPTLAPAQLEYYLKCRIRGAIIDELRAQDWLPRHSRQRGNNARVLFGDDIREFARSGRNEAQVPQRWEDQLVDTGESPDDRLDRLERAAKVRGAIATLPPRDRHVLRRHYMRGVKFFDIAAELRVSEPRISQLHLRAITRMRDALRKEDHDGRGIDRGAGAAAPQGPAQRVVQRAVPCRGLGEPPAPAVDRPVPGGAGGPDHGGAPCEGLREPRPEVLTAGASAAAGDGDGAVTVAEPPPVETVPGPVSSVLPLEGIDLHAELQRYKTWIIEQAMAFADGHVPAAAELIGYTTEGLHYTLRTQGIPRKDGRARRRAAAPGGRGRTPSVAPEPQPTEPAPTPQPAAAPPEPPPAPARAAPAPAVSPEEKLSARISWTEVEGLRQGGLTESEICGILGKRLGVNRYLVEKVLRRRP